MCTATTCRHFSPRWVSQHGHRELPYAETDEVLCLVYLLPMPVLSFEETFVLCSKLCHCFQLERAPRLHLCAIVAAISGAAEEFTVMVQCSF